MVHAGLLLVEKSKCKINNSFLGNFTFSTSHPVYHLIE